MRLCSCSRRITDSAVTLLPEPDSPTRPSVSPGCTVKLTPSTARTTPASVSKYVRRSRTSSSGLRILATPGAGIEPVTDSVSEEVETHHHGEDGEARERRAPPLLHELAAFRHHGAPFRRGRNHAQAEERKPGEHDDRVADVER